ncbi:MAG: rhomboid family intramembrane serine protease [Bacteroidetes bacterium]|nr:rhomboid family intramembrane serine protease [Bacteroidota bacterium]
MQTEFRPGGYSSLPLIVKNLLIINGIVWLSQITIGTSLFPVDKTFALFYYESPFFRPWQVLTYMFLHAPDDFFHLLFNMFALWMFGSTLENLWGPNRFLIFYLLCGLGAALVHMGALWYDVEAVRRLWTEGAINDPSSFYAILNRPTMGASGAVMGIFAAFAYTFPNSQLFILPIPFPVKAKWALAGLVVFDLIGGFSSSPSGVAHFAHVGGAVIGIILVLLWNRKSRSTFY